MLTVNFKEPIRFDPEMPMEEILGILRDRIEQNIPVEKLTWKREDI